MDQSGSAELVVVSKFLGTVGGEAENEIAGWLGDYFRTRRLRSIAKTIVRTQEILKEAGIDPQTVPLKTMSPLLEGAAQEDENDQGMVDRWAALLARASSGEQEIPPHYPALLAQITGRQAAILESLGDTAQQSPLPSDEIQFEYADLERLRLIEVTVRYDQTNLVGLTSLGRGLVSLCTPPHGEGRR